MDAQLMQLMKELGDAINQSLRESKLIAQVVSRLKEGSHDIAMTLEATISVDKRGGTTDNASFVTVIP
jgi:hypothetical protein